MHYDRTAFLYRKDIEPVEQLKIMLALQRGIKDFMHDKYGKTAALQCEEAEKIVAEKLNEEIENEIFGIRFPM